MARTQSPRNGRRRGRPGRELATDVRENILNAAERRFATDGFSATAVRRIANDAGANPAMVHYYFGSKRQLLQAVMERVLEPLAGSISALQAESVVSIGEITYLLFSQLADHPFLPQLVVREVFLPGGQMQEEFLQRFAPRLGGRLPGVLQREQEAGRIDASFDPNVIALLTLSLCFFPFIARLPAETILGIHYDKPGLKKLNEHITRLLERGLQA